MNIGAVKTYEQVEPKLKTIRRSRISEWCRDQPRIRGLVHDDDDTRSGYRVIMEEQGYKAKSVTIGRPCIVEIE